MSTKVTFLNLARQKTWSTPVFFSKFDPSISRKLEGVEKKQSGVENSRKSVGKQAKFQPAIRTWTGVLPIGIDLN